MKQPVLGILTLYLNDNKVLEEKKIYAKMTAAGQRMGLNLFVFTPDDVDFKHNKIHALYYNPKTRIWSRKWTRFPHMIYDRCRIQKSVRFDRLQEFRKKYGNLTFINRPLRNKWTVHKTLSQEEAFKSYLPSTQLASSVSDVQEMLQKHNSVYLKPVNGTGGRGILQIERQKDDRLLLKGRDQDRRIISPVVIEEQELAGYLENWHLDTTKHIVQQGLRLKLPNGRVHDYRLLIQKDRSGRWQYTGCAGRIGPSKSVTSNLHGGGRAVEMNTLLKKWIDEDKAEAVKFEAAVFGLAVAQYLEKSYGRLCELALDIAIDRKGKIWLIEVNPKPAREVFVRAGELDIYRKSIIRPLEYALGLYEQKKKRKAEGKLVQQVAATGGLSTGKRIADSVSSSHSSPKQDSLEQEQ